jgi:hypothetical protein
MEWVYAYVKECSPDRDIIKDLLLTMIYSLMKERTRVPER